MAFEQVFKNIDDILHKDAGCTSELDYTEQSSWLLFLKYLDALEQDKAVEAQLEGRDYAFILDSDHRWETWAAPKSADGKLDHNSAITGDDLRDFVNAKLFPYLAGFKQRASGPNTIEYKIGEVFSEIKNKVQSGYNLRDVIDLVDELRFRSQFEKHELSHLYEAKIKNMGNAGRNGGEYYTPRPLIRAMIKVLDPKIGERIYDGACGSAGFLCEAFDYLLPKATKADDLKTLQTRTFYGKEKKSLAYVIAIMNMILHGIEAPNVIHANTLADNISDIQDRDRYDVILANPPFGGKERKEVQQNFPVKTGETAFLFLQHFIKTLRAGGRAAIVIKNTFLSNTDNASTSIRKLLLESCNLHTVLDMPSGTFQGAGVKTVVLFFEKGAPTRKVWFYQLNPGRNLGKTSPLNDEDLVDFVERQKSFATSVQSWSMDAAGIDAGTYDLSVKNPNAADELEHRTPQEILAQIASLDAESPLLDFTHTNLPEITKVEPLGSLCRTSSGGTPLKSQREYYEGGDIPWLLSGEVAQGDVWEATNFITQSGLQNSSAKMFPPSTVLVAMYGATAGEVGILRIEAATNQAVCGIYPNERYLPEYLYYFLLSKKEELVSKAVGNAQPNISQAKIRETRAPVAEVTDQERVVTFLDAAFDEIEVAKANAENKIAALDELKRSLLDHVFAVKTTG